MTMPMTGTEKAAYVRTVSLTFFAVRAQTKNTHPAGTTNAKEDLGYERPAAKAVAHGIRGYRQYVSGERGNVSIPG